MGGCCRYCATGAACDKIEERARPRFAVTLRLTLSGSRSGTVRAGSLRPSGIWESLTHRIFEQCLGALTVPLYHCLRVCCIVVSSLDSTTDTPLDLPWSSRRARREIEEESGRSVPGWVRRLGGRRGPLLSLVSMPKAILGSPSPTQSHSDTPDARTASSVHRYARGEHGVGCLPPGSGCVGLDVLGFWLVRLDYSKLGLERIGASSILEADRGW
jgi:hypothetical protein